MMKQTTCYSCDKPIEPDYWMIRGEIWSDDIAFLEAHNGTSSEVQAAMEEWENNAVPLYKSPVTTDELSVEKLQEQLNTAKKLLTELAYGECHTCGEKFEDNCEFCSFAYPFCSQECYDNYMKNEGSGDE